MAASKAHLFFNQTKWELLEPGDLFTLRARGLVAADMETGKLGHIEVYVKNNNQAGVGFGWVYHIHISKAAKRPKVNPISDEQRAKRHGRNSKA